MIREQEFKLLPLDRLALKMKYKVYFFIYIYCV